MQSVNVKGLVGCAACAMLLAALGCSENSLIGSGAENRAPEVWLSSGPVEGTTTGYQVHFYWGGWDPDGEIRNFEFVIADGNPFGFDRQDTTGLDKWRRTAAFDSVIRVSANDTASMDSVRDGGAWYTRYDRTHTFFLRAVDLEGKRSEPVYRSFTAWTLAPYVQITAPRPPTPADKVAQLSTRIKWEWKGIDPIDSPENVQDPDSIRYMYHRVDSGGMYKPAFNIVNDLNKQPRRYEKDWSRWIAYRAPEDSGRSTTLGDDEILEVNRSYIFGVQAKDEAGAVTAIFDRKVNVRQFIVTRTSALPLLTITEPFLGGFRFIGTNLRPERRELPPGVTLNFRWRADASAYGGQIQCYQYGWDVSDVNNPSDWDSDCSPFVLGCTATWYSGVHTLFVRVLDNSGGETLGQIEIDVVPFTMDRNLLWVDDFPSNDFMQVDYATPTEREHDAFWIGLCSRAQGFDPVRDVYDAAYGNNSAPPKTSLIGRYRNIIWTYSSALDTGCWDDVILFTPESLIGTGTQLTVNYLAIYLAKGGHLLSEGRSDRTGGLAATLTPGAMIFPMNLRCEITGNRSGCEGDTSGVNTMAYRDYCVTMLDKVNASFRTDADMKPRGGDTVDGLKSAYRDNVDPVTARYPRVPATLALWDEVTKPGRFFYPEVRGFTYVEVYDPAYWMVAKGVRSQGCFHPLFRMRARGLTTSPIDKQTVGLWLTRYETVDPDDAGSGIAAPSMHLGFELWFFNRTAVNSLIDALFEVWGIGLD